MTSTNKRYSLLGSYCPSYFSIQVNSCKDIYATSLLNDSVLFHEYIHFLQDITTTVGYERLYNLISKINHLCLELQGKDEVTVPYTIKSQEWKDDEIVESLIDCHDDYRWVDYKIADIIEDQKRGVVLKIDSLDGTHEVPFGAYQVEEIMAECCESTHPLYIPSNEYPYTLWEKFNDYFGYKLKKQDYARMSYISLNFGHPGMQFYEILKESNSFELDEILKHSFNENLETKKSFRKLATAGMKGLFEKNFPGIITWLENSMLYNKRYDDYETFMSLLDEPMLCPKSEFFYFFMNNGFPIVRDNQGNYGFGVKFDGDRDLYGLVSLMSCIDVLFDKSAFGCPFRKFCEKFEDETKGQRMSPDCLGTPWNYQKDDKLCIMSKMWKSLGFPRDVKRANL